MPATHSIQVRFFKRNDNTGFICDSLQATNGSVDIKLLQHGGDWTRNATRGEQALETLVRRINNAYIHRLTLSFHRMDLPLPYYLRANADRLRYHVRALSIDDTVEVEAYGGKVGIDSALVDFLGSRLKPQIFLASMWTLREEYAMIFKHDALRSSVRRLEYEASKP